MRLILPCITPVVGCSRSNWIPSSFVLQMERESLQILGKLPCSHVLHGSSNDLHAFHSALRARRSWLQLVQNLSVSHLGFAIIRKKFNEHGRSLDDQREHVLVYHYHSASLTYHILPNVSTHSTRVALG